MPIRRPARLEHQAEDVPQVWRAGGRMSGLGWSIPAHPCSDSLSQEHALAPTEEPDRQTCNSCCAVRWLRPAPVRPMPGDAVKLTGPFSVARPGAVGVVGGILGETPEDLHIVFGIMGAFRGASFGRAPDRYVSVSGGPGTIATPAHRLRPTETLEKVRFWRWKDFPS